MLNSMWRNYAGEFAMSRTLYYGKLKSLTGQSPIEFIRTIRLAEAAKLLHQQIPVQEVAERVGFMDAKYFSTVFKKHYACRPVSTNNTKTNSVW